MTMLEDEREEIVEGITTAVRRLAVARHVLTEPQCIEVAETLRDTADEIDHGEGERTRRLVLLTPRGPMGRPLYRLV
jgi:hypothetical protein